MGLIRWLLGSLFDTEVGFQFGFIWKTLILMSIRSEFMGTPNVRAKYVIIRKKINTID